VCYRFAFTLSVLALHSSFLYIYALLYCYVVTILLYEYREKKCRFTVNEEQYGILTCLDLPSLESG